MQTQNSLAFAGASLSGGRTWSTPSESPYARLTTPGADLHTHTHNDATQHTQQPIMTGTSVLGIKYNGGVLLAADTLASYGSLARFDDVSRLFKVGDNTCVAASGDMADFQELQFTLDQLVRDEFVEADGHGLSPSNVYSYLSTLLYNKRSQIDPLWNALIVGGWEESRSNDDPSTTSTGKPFIGYVDLLGTTYTAPAIATGFGAHIAIPLLRSFIERHPQGFGEEEARNALEGCMQVLFYRDARSINKFQIARITAEGVQIGAPQSVHTEWGFGEDVRGYGRQ